MAKHVTISTADIDDFSTESFGHTIAIGPDGTLHIVWKTSFAPGNRQIRYTQSTDGGVTWTDGAGGGPGSFFTVSNPASDSNYPALAVDGTGNVHVVWDDVGTDATLYLRKRNSNGTWNPIDTTSFVINPDLPEITRANILVAPNGSLHIVAFNLSDEFIAWAFSTDGGVNWTINTQLFANISLFLPKPGFGVDSQNNLHLVFIRNTDKAAYAKAVFSGTWSWGAEDITSLNDATVTRQRDCAMLVLGNDDVLALWEAVFNTSTNSMRLRWAKRTGGVGAWSVLGNVINNTTNARSYRAPVGGTVAGTERAFVAFYGFQQSGSQQFGGFLPYDNVPVSVWFNNRAEVANFLNLYNDLYTEDGDGSLVTRVRHPNAPRSVLSTSPVIPVIYTYNQTSPKKLKFTTFSSRFDIPVNLGGSTIRAGVGTQGALVRADAITFHLVYRKSTVPVQVRYQKSVDGGLTWTDGEGGAPGSAFILEQPASGNRDDPSMVVDGDGDLFAVWHNQFTSPSEIFLRRRVGGVWQALDATSLSIAGKNLHNAVAFVDQFGAWHVVAENRTDGALYHAYSTDKGGSWTKNGNVAAFGVNYRFGSSGENRALKVDRDAANNLYVIYARQHTVNIFQDVVVIIKATFTPPATWIWGVPDQNQFAHASTSEDATPGHFWISGDYDDAAGNRMDLVWSTYIGAGNGTATVHHGTLINGVPTVIDLFTVDYLSSLLPLRPRVRGLARDAAGNLYAVINWHVGFGTVGQEEGVYNSAIRLSKGTSSWLDVSPIQRANNTTDIATCETRVPVQAPGDVYAVSNGFFPAGFDDHSTLLVEPVAPLIAAIQTGIQTIQSDTVIDLGVRIKDFLVR